MDCKVCVSTGDWWLMKGGGGGGGGGGQIVGGGLSLSQESEHDLALMVSDFLENGSGGTESWCSSDSDSGLSDLSLLADKIPFCKISVPQYESDLMSVVNSLILSMNDTDLHYVNSGACNASCIRFSLVKLLRRSGYDAAVCATKWQGSGKVPGGDHEYIDVINHNSTGTSERLIIDIDFRSHFEIARAVDSYDRILNSLPVVYAGSLTRLKQFLQIMVDAAKSSLKQNSMPLPPWRSLAYLQAKWQSPYQRHFNPEDPNIGKTNFVDHNQCSGHLKRLQSLLQSEMEAERLLKPINSDSNWRLKPERRRRSFYRTT
ncbi:hypothetical protein RGQ29_029013 [Quercus rubra]|uniref:Plant-specific domain TIGR01615 family protein n=1 Tax=Quercus rubra TaxID=3512 RepID=A0AAN7ETP9_QUERU|nr:hypothetical protein RGQ29_029013 [Quercus rubra]